MQLPFRSCGLLRRECALALFMVVFISLHTEAECFFGRSAFGFDKLRLRRRAEQVVAKFGGGASGVTYKVYG